MIDFIYVIIILVYFLLAFSFIIKEYIIGFIASMGIMITGVYMAIYGVGDISNFLTQAFGIINIGLGAYVFVNTGKEKIEELM